MFDFTLEAEEMQSVTALNKRWRYIVPMIEVSRFFLYLLGLVSCLLANFMFLSSSVCKELHSVGASGNYKLSISLHHPERSEDDCVCIELFSSSS